MGIDITVAVAAEAAIWAILMFAMTLSAVMLRRRSAQASPAQVSGNRQFYDKLHQSVRRGNSGL